MRTDIFDDGNKGLYVGMSLIDMIRRVIKFSMNDGLGWSYRELATKPYLEIL